MPQDDDGKLRDLFAHQREADAVRAPSFDTLLSRDIAHAPSNWPRWAMAAMTVVALTIGVATWRARIEDAPGLRSTAGTPNAPVVPTAIDAAPTLPPVMLTLHTPDTTDFLLRDDGLDIRRDAPRLPAAPPAADTPLLR